MNRLKLTVCATLLACAGPAGAHSKSCDIDSDYDLTLRPNALELSAEAPSSRLLKISDGRLWIDGSEIELSDADRQRMRDIERHSRRIAGQAKDIAIEAVGLAGEAITRVGAALGGKDGDALANKVKALQSEIRQRIEREYREGEFSDKRFEQEVENLVTEFVPAIAGEIASLAVSAALSGDEAAAERFEQRMKTFEQDIEREMKSRSEALERKAEALCPDLLAIEALDQALEVRLADGSPLNLLRVERNP